MKRTYEEETALILELKSKTCPAFIERSQENNWSPDNRAFWVYETAIKDAYWRRRQLTSKEGECAPG